MAEKETSQNEMKRLFRLFGDLPADKAHAAMKTDPTVKALPKRNRVRSTWRVFKEHPNIEQGAVWICTDGRRFLTRQGRYRYCKRTAGVEPVRGD